MKNLIVPVLIIMTAFLSGCASPNCISGWKKIEVGMTQERVVRYLGKPTVTMPPVPIEAPSSAKSSPLDLFRERWWYGDRGPGGSDNLMFLLYFDINGNLVSYRPPLEGPYRNFQTGGK